MGKHSTRSWNNYETRDAPKSIARRQAERRRNGGTATASQDPGAGDEVTVTRIDRLARSTFDLFAIVKRIVDAGAHFRSLAEPWADTSNSAGRLMIAVLGGPADVERDLIRTRTAEGRERARARGQPMGRPRKLNARQQRDALEMRATGATLDEVAKCYNVSRATISRLCVRWISKA